MARRERASTSGTPMVGVTPPPRCRLAEGTCEAGRSGIGGQRSGGRTRRPRRAARPLRTAPSMVAGHPVSVHAPATARPGQAVPGPGSEAAVPGRARKVALRSLVTRESTSRASAGLGQQPAQLGGDPRHQVVGPAAEQVVGSRHRHRHVLRPGRTAGPPRPDDAVRSKTHWTGEPTPARSGQRVTGPVEDQVDVDDGRGAELAEPVLVGRSSPAAGWRRRRRGERPRSPRRPRAVRLGGA